MGIDRNKQSLPARQNLTLLIQDFRHIDVFPALHPDLARLHPQWLVQWHRADVVNRDLLSESNHMPQLVDLTHRLVKKRSDDSSVHMAWRPGVSFAQTKTADEAISLFVVDEFQPHAVRIVLAAPEAVVLLQLDKTRTVARPR